MSRGKLAQEEEERHDRGQECYTHAVPKLLTLMKEGYEGRIDEAAMRGCADNGHGVIGKIQYTITPLFRAITKLSQPTAVSPPTSFLPLLLPVCSVLLLLLLLLNSLPQDSRHGDT
jgi:hypothetical protein